MQWLIAFHVTFVVCWFSGIFYLPRLFVYHTTCDEQQGNERFKIMEHKLYYYITLPSAIVATIFGASLWLPHYEQYSHMTWLHIKLVLVVFLWLYTLRCGYHLKQFKRDKNYYSHKFYRFFNEIPAIILIVIMILSFVKP